MGGEKILSTSSSFFGGGILVGHIHANFDLRFGVFWITSIVIIMVFIHVIYGF